MSGVVTGFAIITFIILVGYVAGRTAVGGPGAESVLNRIAFFVTSPALLFTVLAKADLRLVFSSFVEIALISAVVTFGLFVVLAKLASRFSPAFSMPRGSGTRAAVLAGPATRTPGGTATGSKARLSTGELAIGAMASGYVNANNIGLPVAVYVLGSASYVVPVLLLQVIVIAPIALTILDISSHGSVSVGRLLTQPVRNPMIIASVSGVVVSAIGVTPPAAVLRPIDLLAGAAVPLVLLAFGMSLNGAAPFRHASGRRELAVASILKCAVMPLVAFVLARFVFHLPARALYAAVVLAALPTAQNIYNFASRYERGEAMARDAVLVTTALSAVSVAVIAVLLVRP
jgi:malonate transporter and related proteins